MNPMGTFTLITILASETRWTHTFIVEEIVIAFATIATWVTGAFIQFCKNNKENNFSKLYCQENITYLKCRFIFCWRSIACIVLTDLENKIRGEFRTNFDAIWFLGISYCDASRKVVHYLSCWKRTGKPRAWLEGAAGNIDSHYIFNRRQIHRVNNSRPK